MGVGAQGSNIGGASANSGALATAGYGTGLTITGLSPSAWIGTDIKKPAGTAGFGGASANAGLLGNYGGLDGGSQAGGEKINWKKMGLGAAKGLGWGSLLGGGYMSAASAYQAGQAQGAYHDLVADGLDFNAGQSVIAAKAENEYITKKAAWEMGEMRANLKRLLGKQAATAASSGVGTDSVTFEHIAKDTIKSSLEDEAMVRYNADAAKFENTRRANIEKINLETQAGQQRFAGESARIKGKYDMYGSIFNTAGQAVGMLG